MKAILNGTEIQLGGPSLPPGGATGEVLAKASDTDGDVKWTQRWSDQNLLDNSYWASKDAIINQKGQTEYDANDFVVFYSIDRWSIARSILTILENGIKITLNQDTWINALVQKISMEEIDLRGKTLTFSAFAGDCPDGVFITLQAYDDSDNFISEESIAVSNGDQVISVIYTVPDNAYTIRPTFRIGGSFTTDPVPEGSYITLKAAKLELGSQQTLAHQDADGNWVLNDPPPNKALELAKCQRYFEISAWNITTAIALGTNELPYCGSYYYKAQKRVHPAITIGPGSEGQQIMVYDTVTKTDITGLNALPPIAWNQYMMSPRIHDPQGRFVIGRLYQVVVPDNQYFIDANL